MHAFLQVRDLAAGAQGMGVSHGVLPASAPTTPGANTATSPSSSSAPGSAAFTFGGGSTGAVPGSSSSSSTGGVSGMGARKPSATGPLSSAAGISITSAADIAAGQSGLDILEDSSGMTFVKDLTYVEVASVDEVLAVLKAGMAARAVGGDVSSRSHAVFTISVVQYRENQPPITGRLNLVDLAGSERSTGAPTSGRPSSGHLSTADASTAAALRSKEVRAINVSLTALGKVVLSLAADGDRGHVSFRDTKLTRVLKESLSGNSFTSLLACLHPLPENTDECAATLHFAVRCSNIVTAPQVNVLSGAVGAGGDAALMEALMLQV